MEVLLVALITCVVCAVWRRRQRWARDVLRCVSGAVQCAARCGVLMARRGGCAPGSTVLIELSLVLPYYFPSTALVSATPSLP